MEEEYEHSLQGVEDGEDPGKDESVLVDCKEPQHPGESQEGQQDKGSLDNIAAYMI